MTTAPTLQFLGAAGTVTGSRHLIDTGSARVLVDCGLFQGLRELRDRNRAPFAADPASIDAVVVTHAHLDHTGYLPSLVRNGFAGPIYATESTAALAALVLADSGRLQEEEAEYANRKGYSKHHPAAPLYTEADAIAATERFRSVRFGEDVEVAPGIVARLRRAGHILGSATAHLRLTESDRSVLVSGDLGRMHHPLLMPPEDPPAADAVLVEATYADRRHEEESESLDVLADVVTRTVGRDGVVVIPSFAVDRTEVVLYELGRLMAAGRIPRVPIYADSPMALAVLDIYRRAIAQHDPELRLDSLGGDPFGAAGELHAARSAQESRGLNDVHGAIIISASGMATGGRVLHHLANRLPHRENSVVLVGYQSEGTRGRLLADGVPVVKMLGLYVPVRAEVVQIHGFSVHADGDEVVEWLGRGPQPGVTYVVHGEPRGLSALQRRVRDELHHVAVIPAQGEKVRIG